MKSLPATIALGLASGVTTHCQCWLLTRKDGVTLGFTDHDRTLTIDAQVFEAASGIEASAVESETGLAAANGEITGALTSARVTAEDIEAGRYDGAELRRWLVDWNAPALDCLIDVVTLGEIRRKDGAFIAETRNALHALDLEKGGSTARLARLNSETRLVAWISAIRPGVSRQSWWQRMVAIASAHRSWRRRSPVFSHVVG